ncbi:UNVERIFIED_CONTAM: hypothetical protein HDU68_002751, partial [Siphonaria sp. JEL0065]
MDSKEQSTHTLQDRKSSAKLADLMLSISTEFTHPTTERSPRSTSLKNPAIQMAPNPSRYSKQSISSDDGSFFQPSHPRSESVCSAASEVSFSLSQQGSFTLASLYALNP